MFHETNIFDASSLHVIAEVAKCAQHRFAYGGIFTEKYDFEDMFTKVESMDYIARLTLFAKASGTVSIRLGVYSSQDEEYGEYYDIGIYSFVYIVWINKF